MSEKAYDLEESDNEDRDGRVLIGPDGFECCLQEPEDATWYRDGRQAWDRLNKQHEEIEALRAKLASAYEDAARVADEAAEYEQGAIEFGSLAARERKIKAQSVAAAIRARGREVAGGK